MLLVLLTANASHYVWVCVDGLLEFHFVLNRNVRTLNDLQEGTTRRLAEACVEWRRDHTVATGIPVVYCDTSRIIHCFAGQYNAKSVSRYSGDGEKDIAHFWFYIVVWIF